MCVRISGLGRKGKTSVDGRDGTERGRGELDSAKEGKGGREEEKEEGMEGGKEREERETGRQSMEERLTSVTLCSLSSYRLTRRNLLRYADEIHKHAMICNIGNIQPVVGWDLRRRMHAAARSGSRVEECRRD